MAFNPKIAEAQLALNLISATEIPKLAWDALESGLDGPAIRRLAAMDLPTSFQIAEAMGPAMAELGLTKISASEAAVRLAKHRAQEILRANSDPMKHLRDFEHLWIESDYCAELSEYGNLVDEVYVAQLDNQPEAEIHDWVTERFKRLADS